MQQYLFDLTQRILSFQADRFLTSWAGDLDSSYVVWLSHSDAFKEINKKMVDRRSPGADRSWADSHALFLEIPSWFQRAILCKSCLV